MLSGSKGAAALTAYPLSMLGKEPARLLLPWEQNHRDRPSSTVFICFLTSQSSKSKAGKPAAVVSDKELFLACKRSLPVWDRGTGQGKRTL